jgi:hypothetical protein
MLCPKCNKETIVELLLDYKIHKCPCGFREITDYDDKEIDHLTRLMLEDIYNEN